MLIIEWAKFILKTGGSQLTVEAMTCKAIKTNFHDNELYLLKNQLIYCPLQQNEKPYIVFRYHNFKAGKQSFSASSVSANQVEEILP